MALVWLLITLASARGKEGVWSLRVRVALRVPAFLTASRVSNLDTRGPSLDAVVRRRRIPSEVVGSGGALRGFLSVPGTGWSGGFCPPSAWTVCPASASSLSPLLSRQGIRSGAGAQSALGLLTPKRRGELGAELHGDSMVGRE